MTEIKRAPRTHAPLNFLSTLITADADHLDSSSPLDREVRSSAFFRRRLGNGAARSSTLLVNNLLRMPVY